MIFTVQGLQHKWFGIFIFILIIIPLLRRHVYKVIDRAIKIHDSSHLTNKAYKHKKHYLKQSNMHFLWLKKLEKPRLI